VPSRLDARRRKGNDLACREGRAEPYSLAPREGDGVPAPVGADLRCEGAMGDEASGPVMRVATLRRNHPIELADELIEVSRGGGRGVERQRWAIEPPNRLEKELDRDSAVEELRGGGTNFWHFETIMDSEGDMRPISGLAQGGRECGGFTLQIEEWRGIALLDP
jgi:hypothetical protein